MGVLRINHHNQSNAKTVAKFPETGIIIYILGTINLAIVLYG